MTTPQHKIGSGSGARSTADDVLRGIDLSGKLAIVTGGCSGIGLETTRALAGAGAHVVVPARRRVTAQEAVDGIDGVEVDELDLSDLQSVRGFAERFVAPDRGVDLVITSAGITACPETRVGPGWEAQFAINHLGHYALVNRLWPAIARRVAGVLAGSSLYIHLTHWQVFPRLDDHSPPLAMIASLAAGIAYAAVATRVMRRLPSLRRRRGGGPANSRVPAG